MPILKARNCSIRKGNWQIEKDYFALQQRDLTLYAQ
jgi:hypothetical protein